MKRIAAISTILLLSGAAVAQQVAPGHLLGNPTATTSRATDATLTAIIDRALCSAQGSVLYRDSTAWRCLQPSVGTAVLTSNGTGADPTWSGVVTGLGGIVGSFDVPYGLATSGNSLRIDWTAFPSWMGGCTLSTAITVSTTINVTPCMSVSDDNSTPMNAPIFVKTTDAWHVGTGNGCLDTGSLSANSWYAIFAIRKTTGLVDYVCTKEVSEVTPSPSMPVTYTKKRYIGSFKTDATPNIRKFLQNGDTFYYDVPSMDVAANNPGTAAVNNALSVPLGLVTEAILNIVEYSGGSAHYMLASPVSATDLTPSLTALTLNAGNVSSYYNTQARVLTDHSGRIRTRNSASNVSDLTTIYTLGYRDTNRAGN